MRGRVLEQGAGPVEVNWDEEHGENVQKGKAVSFRLQPLVKVVKDYLRI